MDNKENTLRLAADVENGLRVGMKAQYRRRRVAVDARHFAAVAAVLVPVAAAIRAIPATSPVVACSFGRHDDMLLLFNQIVSML